MKLKIICPFSLGRFELRNTLTRHVYSNHKIGGGKQESMLDTDIITCPHGIEGAPSSNDMLCLCTRALLLLVKLHCLGYGSIDVGSRMRIHWFTDLRSFEKMRKKNTSINKTTLIN